MRAEILLFVLLLLSSCGLKGLTPDRDFKSEILSFLDASSVDTVTFKLDDLYSIGLDRLHIIHHDSRCATEVTSCLGIVDSQLEGVSYDLIGVFGIKEDLVVFRSDNSNLSGHINLIDSGFESQFVYTDSDMLQAIKSNTNEMWSLGKLNEHR